MLVGGFSRNEQANILHAIKVERTPKHLVAEAYKCSIEQIEMVLQEERERIVEFRENRKRRVEKRRKSSGGSGSKI